MGAPRAGRVSDIDVETTVGGGTYTALAGVQDASLALAMTPIDVTDKDSNGVDEFIAGQSTYKLSGTMVYEEDDAGQAILITMAINKELRLFRFRPWGVSVGADQWVAYGVVTSLQIDSPNKEAISTPFEVQLSGTPTLSNQT